MDKTTGDTSFEIDEKGLRQFAFDFAKRLQAGDAVGLVGPLGAGKTTLVRYLAEAFGCVVPVSSPTYVLCHEYYSAANPPLKIEHWDLYRLMGMPEELWQERKDCLRCIEWSDKFPELRSYLTVEITMSLLDGFETRRCISVKSVEPVSPGPSAATDK